MSRQKHFVIIGETYNQLTVLESVGIIKRYTSYKCSCSCGKTIIIKGVSLFGKNPTRSCGCLIGKNLIPLNKRKKRKHGLTHTSFYNIWCGLKQRCNDKNTKQYKFYGGRGITYDPRWDDFINFKKDMYLKYLYAVKQLKMKKTSIERIDSNGNYCKENCCWIPLKLQAKNTSRIKPFDAFDPNGKKYTNIKNQSDFAKIHKLQPTLISQCLLGKRKHHKQWLFTYNKNGESNETIKSQKIIKKEQK